MSLTIVIPTLNTHDDPDVRKKIVYSRNLCVNSLLKTTPSNVEIIISSNRGFLPSIVSVPDVRIKTINVSDQGQCKAVNAAVSTVSTQYVMVTNDDMIYPEGWYEKLMVNLNRVSCVSPVLVEPIDGAPTFEKYFCGGAGGDYDSDKFEEFAKNHKGDGLRTGFNLPFIIKKDLWDLVGGYDVKYDPFGSNSDSDLLYKIRLAGVQPFQDTNTVVYHFSQTSGTFHPSKQNYWQNNWNYFIDKWGFERESERIWQADFIVPFKERKFRPVWEGCYSR